MYLTVLVPSITLGLLLNSYNLAGTVIAAELGETRTGLMSSFVYDGAMMGMLFGSAATGKIVRYPKLGRIGTMKLGNLLVILGCLPLLALNIWAQILGRFIIGFGVALVLVGVTIYVLETLPGQFIGKCLTAFNIGISFGYVLGSII